MNLQKAFIVEGVVEENLPNTMFRVKVTAGEESLKDKVILCHLAGRMRLHWVRLLPGDRIRCEVYPIDTARGRIVYKLK